MTSQQDIQTKYLQVELLKEQLDELVKERTLMNQQVSDIQQTINTIDEISKIKKGTRVWTPLGSGTFVKSTLDSTKRIMVSVGADIIMEKTAEEARDILGERMKELKNTELELDKSITEFTKALDKTEKELQDLVVKAQKQKK